MKAAESIVERFGNQHCKSLSSANIQVLHPCEACLPPNRWVVVASAVAVFALIFRLQQPQRLVELPGIVALLNSALQRYSKRLYSL